MKLVSIKELPLRRKIWISFSLTTLLPFLIFLYYVEKKEHPFIISICSVVIIFGGWWIIVETIMVANRAYKRVRKFLDENKLLDVDSFKDNSIDGMVEVVERLSSKVRTSLDQLKDLGKQTEILSKEVSRKALVLSTILQINDLFTKKTPIDEIIHFVTPHIKDILNVQLVFCILFEEKIDKYKVLGYQGPDINLLEEFIIEHKDFLKNLRGVYVKDKNNLQKDGISWKNKLCVDNILIKPLISNNKSIGIIAVGFVGEDFIFGKELIDTVDLFAQNITILWEHYNLYSRVEELEIFDPLTGFYTEKFTISRLEEEIKRAQIYQRPCSYMVVEVINYADYQKEFGTLEAERLIKKIASLLKEMGSSVDILGRIKENKLSIIFVERNKRQSLQIEQKFRDSVKSTIPEVRVNTGLAEIPLDGVSLEEILKAIDKQLSK